MHFNLDSLDTPMYPGVFKAPQGVYLQSHFIFFIFCFCSHWRNKRGSLNSESWAVFGLWRNGGQGAWLRTLLRVSACMGTWAPFTCPVLFHAPRQSAAPPSLSELGSWVILLTSSPTRWIMEFLKSIYISSLPSLGNRPKGIHQNVAFHDEKLHHGVLDRDFHNICSMDCPWVWETYS